METLENEVIGYAKKDNWEKAQAVEHMTDTAMICVDRHYSFVKRAGETWEDHGYKLALTSEELEPVTLDKLLVTILKRSDIDCDTYRRALRLPVLSCSDCTKIDGSCTKTMASWIKSLKS